MLVFIDPGHGGADPGAVAGDLLEKNLVLEISLELDAALRRRYVVDTLLSRTRDTTVSLWQRVQGANKAGADLFLSVHCNAGGGTGFESYVHPRAPERTYARRRVLHGEISVYIRGLGVVDRGMKTADFYVLRETTMSAVLLEVLFVDHPRDAVLLRDAVFIRGFAAAAARGVGKALGLPALDPGEDKDAVIARLEAEAARLRDEVGRLRNVLGHIRDEAAAALRVGS